MSIPAGTLREHSHKTATKRPREVTPASLHSLQPLAPGALLQRAALAPESLGPAEFLRLQQILGNRATGALLTRPSGQLPIIQAKLTVNAPGDEYEREADRVAEQVMRMPSVQREALEEDETPEIMTKREQAHAADGAFEAGNAFEQQLRASRGQGQPLPPTLKEEFEAKFGADFSGLRIHTDSQSAEMNRAIQARAFTHGQDIYLGAGQCCLGRDGGKRLLAHELTHVVQQNGELKQQHRPLGGPVPENGAQPKQTLAALRERHDLEGSGGDGQHKSDSVQSVLVPGSENVAERQHVAYLLEIRNGNFRDVIQPWRPYPRLVDKARVGHFANFEESGKFLVFEKTANRHISVPKVFQADRWDSFHVTYTKDPTSPTLGEREDGRQPHIYFTDEPKLDEAETKASGQNRAYRNDKAFQRNKKLSNTEKRKLGVFNIDTLTDDHKAKLSEGAWNTVVNDAREVARTWCNKLDGLKISRET